MWSILIGECVNDHDLTIIIVLLTCFASRYIDTKHMFPHALMLGAHLRFAWDTFAAFWVPVVQIVKHDPVFHSSHQ